MKVTLSHREMLRNGQSREYVDGATYLDERLTRNIRRFAKLYRTTPAGMIAIALAYYFADGKNHLGCEHCYYGQDDFKDCALPIEGEQTTLPILDKGSVVVGLSTSDLGE